MRTSLTSALLLLLAPLASAQEPDTFVRFGLDSNAEVCVFLDGRLVAPGMAHRVEAGPVRLRIEYHDGAGWIEERLTLDAPKGMTSTFVLTLRVRLRTWQA